MAQQEHPFRMGAGNPVGSPASSQHGTAEQWAGTVFSSDMGGRFGMTPPASPRRTSPRTLPRSPSAQRRPRGHDEDEDHRDRERESRRRMPREQTEDPPIPQGWGARMLAFENRLRELGEAVTDVKKVVNEVNDRANNKIDEMRKFVQEVGGRFDNLEQALPERIHKLEIRNDGLIETLNEVTKNIYNRFEEMNNSMTSANPPNFGGPTTAQAFNIGSPLSGPPTTAQNASPQPTSDPWAAFAKSRTSQAPTDAYAPHQNPPPSANSGPRPAPQGPHKPWDARMWSIADAKVSKELRPFNGTHQTYKTWANRVKDHFIKKSSD